MCEGSLRVDRGLLCARTEQPVGPSQLIPSQLHPTSELAPGTRSFEAHLKQFPSRTFSHVVHWPVLLIPLKPDHTFCGYPGRNLLSGAYEEIIITSYINHSKVFKRPKASPRGAPKVKSLVLRCLWVSFHPKDLYKAHHLA